MALRFPAGVDEKDFLSQFWQREPLLIPGALTGLLPDFSAAELAGLACEDDIEARLIRSAGFPTQWQLQQSPLREADFEQLPASHWSLLVQDVDKYVPAVAELLKHFRFIPNWRVDDVMISYAAPGGTVGPHIDEYDVFLIQGAGSRIWETGRSNGYLIPDLPLRVLDEFEMEQRWELNTGDVLYLPPGLAHHGHSDEACMTLSVGFFAPSLSAVLFSQAEYRAERLSGRYSDVDLAPDEADDGLISEAAVERALELLRGMTESAADAAVWFGQLVTENKPWLLPPPIDTPQTADEFARRLEQGERLQKHPGARMAHSGSPGKGMLFVDGVALPLSSANRLLAPVLCRGDTPAYSSGSVELLYRLYCDGKLYWTDDE